SCECLQFSFSGRSDVLRTDHIEIVDFGAPNEFVDFDGPRALKRNRLDLFIVDLDVAALVDLIALDDLVLAHFLAGVLIDLAVADAVARFLVDLIEADLLAFAGRGEKLNRTRHQGKAQEALPVRTRGHGSLLLGTDAQCTFFQRMTHRFVAPCSQSVPGAMKVSKNLSI